MISNMDEKMRFTSEIERSIHKKISSIRYGECISIETFVKTEEDKKAIKKAIDKSASYNNLEIRTKWSKDLSYIQVTSDL